VRPNNRSQSAPNHFVLTDSSSKSLTKAYKCIEAHKTKGNLLRDRDNVGL
jgi:hypothetical protein